MRFNKIFFIAFFILESLSSAFSQSTITLKYFGLTIHPLGDKSAYIQPYKLDDKARFVANFGGFAGYEHYVWEDLISVKIIQGVFTDCSGGLAGVTHIGGRVLVLDKGKHRLMCGLGPTLLYRDSWHRFGNLYESSGFFNEYRSKLLGDVQWKFFIVGFEFEYDFKVSSKTDLSLSFTPGLPMACTFAVGVKYWFSKDFKKTVQLIRPKKNEK